jgi:3D (Asp-Asp-Asp) domain-containing protein
MIIRIALMLIAVCAFATAARAGQEDFSMPPPSVLGVAGLNLWATHYYVHVAAETPTGFPLRDKFGNALTGNLSPKDWCRGAIEGTIQVGSAGRLKTLNYAGARGKVQVDCAATLKIDPKTKPWISSVGKSFFSSAKGPFGDGVGGFVLVQYRTIAVDPTQIPFGTALYIPKARGVEITIVPGVTVRHDGYFFAADTGGAIKGHHIDVFCGASSLNCFPSFITSDEKMGFEASIVTDETLVSKLKGYHKP